MILQANNNSLENILKRIVPNKPRMTDGTASKVVEKRGRQSSASSQQQNFRKYLKYVDPMLQYSDESTDASKLSQDLQRILDTFAPRPVFQDPTDGLIARNNDENIRNNKMKKQQKNQQKAQKWNAKQQKNQQIAQQQQQQQQQQQKIADFSNKLAAKKIQRAFQGSRKPKSIETQTDMLDRLSTPGIVYQGNGKDKRISDKNIGAKTSRGTNALKFTASGEIDGRSLKNSNVKSVTPKKQKP
jgi:hypothetical protein